MGQPDINELTLIIEWDGDTPISVRRVDHEGCGGEGPKFTPRTPVLDLVSEFVNHCAKSHDIHRPSRSAAIRRFSMLVTLRSSEFVVVCRSTVTTSSIFWRSDGKNTDIRNRQYP